MDVRRGDEADGVGNQSYTLVNLCEGDRLLGCQKTSKIHPSAL